MPVAPPCTKYEICIEQDGRKWTWVVHESERSLVGYDMNFAPRWYYGWRTVPGGQGKERSEIKAEMAARVFLAWRICVENERKREAVEKAKHPPRIISV